MGFQNREKESKLLVQGMQNRALVAAKIHEIIEGHRGVFRLIEGNSNDIYWAPPAGAKADFIRVRYMAEGRTQLTLKHQDKGSYLDRVEIDVDADDPDQAIAFMTNLLGPPQGSVKKKYTVLFLDKKDTTVSIYKVINDNRVFVEVEAREQSVVDSLVALLKEKLGYQLTSVDQSLYSLFVQGNST